MTDRITNAVTFPSRGNPERLIATVLALDAMATHPDRIRYVVRADDDDPATLDALGRLGQHARVLVQLGPRPLSLGAESNALCAAVEADYYHFWGDDLFPTTVGWDLAAPQAGHLVSCWTIITAQGAPPDYPVISKKWLNACFGQPMSGLFPFWFDDRWLKDVTLLVLGKLPNLPIGVQARKKHRSQRMRDLGFWFDYYLALEPMRVQQAQHVAKNLGLAPMPGFDEAVRQLRALNEADAVGAAARHAGLVDLREPDEAYLEARHFAEMRLAQLRLGQQVRAAE